MFWFLQTVTWNVVFSNVCHNMCNNSCNEISRGMLFPNTTSTSMRSVMLIIFFNYLTGGDTLRGFSVHVSDTTDWRSGTLCYQHDIEQPLNNTVNIDCFTSGRYVTFFNSRNQTNIPSLSKYAYINICDINIEGK